MLTDWLIPVLTFASGVAGGFAGARGAIVRLETQMEHVRAEMKTVLTKLGRHNDDLLIHDAEMDSVMIKLQMARVRRQRILE